jgi:hypothetical protein
MLNWHKTFRGSAEHARVLEARWIGWEVAGDLELQEISRGNITRTSLTFDIYTSKNVTYTCLAAYKGS